MKVFGVKMLGAKILKAKLCRITLYRIKMASQMMSPPPAGSCPLITGRVFGIRAEKRVPLWTTWPDVNCPTLRALTPIMESEV